MRVFGYNTPTCYTWVLVTDRFIFLFIYSGFWYKKNCIETTLFSKALRWKSILFHSQDHKSTHSYNNEIYQLMNQKIPVKFRFHEIKYYSIWNHVQFKQA